MGLKQTASSRRPQTKAGCGGGYNGKDHRAKAFHVNYVEFGEDVEFSDDDGAEDVELENAGHDNRLPRITKRPHQLLR